MQCNGDKTDCQDGSQLGRRESGRTTDNKPRGSYAMDMQYVRHDTHKSNSQAQTGNDSGSAHNTDSGAYGLSIRRQRQMCIRDSTHPPRLRRRPRQQHHLMRLPRPRRVFRLRLHPAHQFRGQRIATERMAIGAKRTDLVRTLSVKMFLKRTKRTMCMRQNAASPWEQSLYSHLCQRF